MSSSLCCTWYKLQSILLIQNCFPKYRLYLAKCVIAEVQRIGFEDLCSCSLTAIMWLARASFALKNADILMLNDEDMGVVAVRFSCNLCTVHKYAYTSLFSFLRHLWYLEKCEVWIWYLGFQHISEEFKSRNQSLGSCNRFLDPCMLRDVFWLVDENAPGYCFYWWGWCNHRRSSFQCSIWSRSRGPS